MVDVVVHTAPDREVVARCVDVYAAAFGEPPYDETREQAEELVDRVARYGDRDGFALVTADVADRIVGFGLVVTAHPGDWWRDRVAEALESEAPLGDAVTEIVHLAVVPDARQRGVGAALLTAMVRPDLPAVLSCHPEATPAQSLYLRHGFAVVHRVFRTTPDRSGAWLMVRPADHANAG